MRFQQGNTFGFKIGQIPWNKGISQSPEAKEKNRLAHLGKNKGKNNPMYGKPHTLEARLKISASKIGKKHSEETRWKQHLSHQGLIPSKWGAGFKKGHIPWNKQSWKNAYFAGLIDGEASIFIAGNSPRTPDRRYVKVGVKIQLADGLEMLKECQAKWGGWIYKRERSKKNPKWSDSYEWKVECGKAEQVLKDVRPYLRIKKRQADIALEYRHLQTKKRTIEAGGIGLTTILPEELVYRKKLEAELKSLKLNKGRKNGNLYRQV